jgi:hypothetical protein
MKSQFFALVLASTLLIGCSSTGSQNGSQPGSQTESEQSIKVHQIKFAHGASSAKVEGVIAGRESIDYKLGARAGQTMSVALQTSNASNYFNVLPPGAETALFVGSTSGNKWTGTLPSNGEYTIRVYLMGSVANRNEKVNYALSVSISDGESRTAPAGDAKVPGTPYHATGEIPCVVALGQPTGSCPFGVIREGNGSGIVTVTKPDGRTRAIFFKNGKATGYDQSQSDTGKFSATKQGDMNIIRIGA